MNRTLLVASTLGLAAAAGMAACKPAADTFDAGCYPAVISTPADGGWDGGCTPWTQGCSSQGTAALQETILNDFDAAGTCASVTDCGLYAAYTSQLKIQCFQTYDVPPIALAQRGQLDQQLQSLLCGFCNACFAADAGGGILDSDPNPPADAGNCTEVQCVSGFCSVQNFEL
jgi:hypothetical protein